jgi:hypothetical protein
MATIVVNSKNVMRTRRQNRIAYFLEGATQSFKAGHVVVLNAGKVVKGASDPAAGTVLGLAAEDATGITDSKVGVFVGDEGGEFIGNVQDTGALALANVGLSCGLVLDAVNNIFRVDLGDTTNLQVKVTELVDAVGDINGLVVFKFLNAARVPYAS